MISFNTIFRLTTAALAAGLPKAVVAASSDKYTLTQLYDQWNFFKEFDFQGPGDPSNGYVTYVNAETANRDKLAGYVDGLIYLGVDHTNVTTGPRPSVRVNSTKAFNGGLFVADVVHMPSGKTDNDSCGLWPAFWLSGRNWPYDGEIDIIEGRNTQSKPLITLHTGPNCKDMSNKGSLKTTIIEQQDCNGAEGCHQRTTIDRAYGAEFNSAGGGIYVVEWTDDHVSTWFFGRGTEMPPSLSGAIASISSAAMDYSSASPPEPALQIDVSSFGTPVARFNSGPSCCIKDNLRNNQFIINTDFCGFASDTWNTTAPCKDRALSCQEYVMKNPKAFEDAYWLIKSISVYQKSGGGAPEATGSNSTSSNKREQHGVGGVRKKIIGGCFFRA